MALDMEDYTTLVLIANGMDCKTDRLISFLSHSIDRSLKVPTYSYSRSSSERKKHFVWSLKLVVESSDCFQSLTLIPDTELAHWVSKSAKYATRRGSIQSLGSVSIARFLGLCKIGLPPASDSCLDRRWYCSSALGKATSTHIHEAVVLHLYILA